MVKKLKSKSDDFSYGMYIDQKLEKLSAEFGGPENIPTYEIFDLYEIFLEPIPPDSTELVTIKLENSLRLRKKRLCQKLIDSRDSKNILEELNKIEYALGNLGINPLEFILNIGGISTNKTPARLPKEKREYVRRKIQYIPIEKGPSDSSYDKNLEIIIKENILVKEETKPVQYVNTKPSSNNKAVEVKLIQSDSLLVMKDKAKSELEARLGKSWLIENIFESMKYQDGWYVNIDYLNKVLNEIIGYAQFSFHLFANETGIKNFNIVANIISSYPDTTIKDIIPIVNPYLRFDKSIYVIKKGIIIKDILPKLEAIQKSLKFGDLSYKGVSEILRQKRIPADHPSFDNIIENVFRRKLDGTYTLESVAIFDELTKGYSFVNLNKLFNNSNTTNVIISALSKYRGDFAKPIKIFDTSNHSSHPKTVYLFRCDEDGRVNKNKLLKELKISF